MTLACAARIMGIPEHDFSGFVLRRMKTRNTLPTSMNRAICSDKVSISSINNDSELCISIRMAVVICASVSEEGTLMRDHTMQCIQAYISRLCLSGNRYSVTCSMSVCVSRPLPKFAPRIDNTCSPKARS